MTFEVNNTIAFITGLTGIIGTMITTHRWAYKRGLNNSERERKNTALYNRYKFIYTPLRQMLMDMHISTAISVKYGFFSQRWTRSIKDFKKLKLISGIKKLKDKGVSKRIAGIDYGGEFPLNKMQKIIQDNLEWADPRILSLVQWAERAQYDGIYQNYNQKTRDASMMTSEELELSDYIYDKFNELNKKLMPK